MRGRCQRQGGFTVLELIFGMSILLVGLAGLLTMHKVQLRGVRTADHSVDATLLAKQTIEDLRQMSVAQIEAAFGPAPLAVDLASATGRAGAVFRRRLEMRAIDAELVRLRIAVSWTDDGAAAGAAGGIHDHTAALELVRAREETL